MKNEISVRQVCFILFAYSAGTKLLNYPTYMAYLCGNALLFPALINIVLQTAVIWVVAYLSSKTDKTFFQLLQDTFGDIAARVVYALFALYFALNAIVPMTEQQLFVHGVFYDTIPSLLVFLPFFIFSIYAGAKGFTNAGRTADICFPIFVISTVCLFIMSISECRWDLLLPVLTQPTGDVAAASLGSSVRFSDSAFLLMFIGRYPYRKGDSAKITLSYAAGGAVVLIFMAIFYAIYGELSPEQPYVIGKISIFFTAINLIGKIDLFAVYAFDIVLLFALVLNVQMCAHCLSSVFARPAHRAYSLAVNALLLACCLLLNNKFVALNYFAYKWLWIAALVFAYLLPLSAWLLRRER